jgi:prevent-host-death family protein
MNDLAERSLPCAEAQEKLDDLLKRAAKHKERVVLTKRGRAVAALVPIEDLHLIEAIENQLDADEFKRAKQEFERSGDPTISWEKVKEDVGL